MHKTLALTLTTATLAGTALVATSQADAATVGRAGASGDYAVAVASGTAQRPATMAVRVEASPAQSVSVSWTAVCSRGFSASSRSGMFTVRAPATRAIRPSMPRASSCIVSAAAQLQGSGPLAVSLLSTRR